MDTIMLSDLFRRTSDNLRAELSQFKLPRDYELIQETVSNHINSLFAEGGDYWLSLNKSDAELLSSAMKIATCFQKLTLSNQVNYKELSKKVKQNAVEDNSSEAEIIANAMTLVPTIICAFINPWLAFAVGGATLGYKTVSGKSKDKTTKTEITDISKNLSSDTISLIISTLEEICSQVDAIIQKNRSNISELKHRFEEEKKEFSLDAKYKELLKEIQYLYVKDSLSSINDTIQNLVMTLNIYGYSIVSYSPDKDVHFTKQIKHGISEPTMYLPAIIKETEDGKMVTAISGVLYIPQS